MSPNLYFAQKIDKICLIFSVWQLVLDHWMTPLNGETPSFELLSQHPRHFQNWEIPRAHLLLNCTDMLGFWLSSELFWVEKRVQERH